MAALGVVAVWVLGGVIPVVANAQQRTSAPTSLVLDGVTVVDVEQGKLLPDQRVVITGNRIQAVGGAAAVKAPKEAQLVDARGKYLIPGLWDMHVHPRINVDSAQLSDYPTMYFSLLIASGVTGIRDAGSDAPLAKHMEWQRAILAGTQVGPPRQLLAGRRLGTPVYGGLEPEDTGSVEGWKRLVDSLKAAGTNFVKMYPFSFPAAAAVRQAGLPFGGHVGGEMHGEISALDASDSGMVIIDHINTSGGIDTLCFKPQGGTVDLCQPAAARLRRNGTWFVPTLAALAAGGASEGQGGLGERSQPVFDRFNERVTEFWAGSRLAGNWLRDSLGNGVLLPASTDSVGTLSVMQRAGLPLLVGSDVMWNQLHTFPPGFAFHAELAMDVAEGLSPLTVLQAATLSPAKMLHATDSLGTVAAGKLADLVLLDADPLADITNTTTIRAVIANGRYFDRAALDQLLAEVQSKAKAEGAKPEP